MAAGGGAAHAHGRTLGGWSAALMPGGSQPGAGIGTTGAVQAVVDKELQKWGDIWKANECAQTICRLGRP